MKLVMTLLVRDEEDILAANFDFHLSQGVDLFIVTDNLSVDGTRDIVDRYVRSGVAVYLQEPGDDYSQFRWVTRMARMAAERYGAEWVINSDADEFWVGASASGGIKPDLAAAAADVQSLSVPRFNFVPVDEDRTFFAERMTYRERVSFTSDGHVLPPKVCHRALTDIEVEQGNHGVRRHGVPLEAPPGSLRILHYPMRSYRQFENKIRKGGEAYARNAELPLETGRTWRDLYESWKRGGLQDLYMEKVLSPRVRDSRVLLGDLVYDDTVITALRRRRVGAPQ